MKHVFLSLLLFFSCVSAVFSQSKLFDLGRINFSISPKILDNGSITDISLGYGYTDTLYGVLRFRNTLSSMNEELLDVADSLNAVNEKTYEVFLLPVEYYFFKTENIRSWIGGGLYYQYSTLDEKGFFNMPSLETMTPPRERVNSYTNSFRMHLLGPLVEAGILYNSPWVNVSFSGGISPVFLLSSSQKMSIDPLISGFAEYSQDTGGSPYMYFSLDSVIMKYVNLVLLYDFARLDYKTVDFDASLNWINPERTVTTQSFKIEASVLLPLGDMRAQIGYGWTFDSTLIEGGSSVNGNRQYVILAAKKSGN